MVTINREKGTFLGQTEPNPNIGLSSICPPIQDNVKRVNTITSLRLGHLIDHNLEDLMDVPIQLSPSLSSLSLIENDSASRGATDGTSIGSVSYTHLTLPTKRIV